MPKAHLTVSVKMPKMNRHMKYITKVIIK